MKARNPTMMLTLSAAFEYYDFIIYSFMSYYLGMLFFPDDNQLLGQIKAFSVFALGYVVRPLGGILLGIWGDLRNRREIFIRSNLILAITTITMSFLPVYSNIGIMAPICLILLRLVQAFAFATELPGAMTLIQENTKSPAKNFGFVVSGTAIGALLASSCLLTLEEIFTTQEILEFAWRIPFLLSGFLALVAIHMRRKLPLFSQKQFEPKEFIEMFISNYRNILYCILMISLLSYLVIMNLFFPSFIPKFYGYSIKEVCFAITISLCWSMFCSPILGHLFAKKSPLSLFKVIAVATIFLGFLINFLFLRKSFIHLVVGLCLYQTIISSLMVVIFPLMSKVFPSAIRFSLMAICYNISYAIIAFSPILIAHFAETLHSPIAIWLGLFVMCVFTLFNTSNFEENNDE